MTTATVAYGMAPSSSESPEATSFVQLCAGEAGNGEHDAVAGDRSSARIDEPRPAAAFRALPDRSDRRVRSQLGTSLLGLGTAGIDEPAEPAAQAEERRGWRPGSGRRRGRCGERCDDVPVTDEGSSDLWCRRAEGHRVDASGVDATEQWIDQAVDDFVPEARPQDLAR